MKKILCVLIALLILPLHVFAKEAITVDTSDMEILVSETQKIKIKVYNIVGDVTVTSSDNSVVLPAKEFIGYDTSDEETYETEIEKEVEIEVTGVSEGTATITLLFNGYTFDDNEDSDIDMTKTINVTVKKSEGATYCVITYDANGGINAPISQTKITSGEITLTRDVPTREGYEFTGWNTSSDGSGTKYESGGKYSGAEDITLYAQWKETGNVTDNPHTGDTLIYAVLLVTLGALIYSYWYMKKAQEN